MRENPPSKLERRVAEAAGAALARQNYVAPLDVLTGIGWLPQTLVDTWRQGRVDCLEELMSAQPGKRASALEYLVHWARGAGDAGRDQLRGRDKGPAGAALHRRR